jgi:hypothetical protein
VLGLDSIANLGPEFCRLTPGLKEGGRIYGPPLELLEHLQPNLLGPYLIIWVVCSKNNHERAPKCAPILVGLLNFPSKHLLQGPSQIFPKVGPTSFSGPPRRTQLTR